MKVLITGAAGFVGYHLASALIKEGVGVVGLDNYNSYYDPQIKRDRASLLSIPIIQGSIQDRDLLNQLIDQHEITHIVHLAAQAGVRHSLADPNIYIESNITGFLSILEACRRKPHIHLVFASSSSVYGLNKDTPFRVEDRTDCPTSLYGATKKANETMAHAYFHLFGFPITALRYFTVYGPWGRPDMAYYQFTRKILAEEPIEVFNHGKLKRDFTYIDDIIAGTRAALQHPNRFQIFNLGNNKPVELMRFIDLLEENLGKKAIRKFIPMQMGDVLETYADIEHSQKILGFSPKISLEEGLGHFVKWYRSYHEKKDL
jgi:UDP-glucuronate 4-epimerase